MKQIIANLQKWGVEGFNNHEEMAFRVGYINQHFSEYLVAKKKLLEARDAAADKNTKKCLNAMRIYSYTLFENTWFGYLTAYSEDQKSIFKVDNTELEFRNAFRNHLPSFSSAIFNFGTCRNLFFTLLKLCADPMLVNDQAGIKELLKVQYRSVADFKADLSNLSSDPSYLKEGEDFYNRNMFRNFFAHRIRLLWWHNQSCSKADYYVARHVYDAIQKRNHSGYLKHVEDVFEDQASYENWIAASNCADLISAADMLKETHDVIAHFLNRSLGLFKLEGKKGT
jgi:hypothetical protein